MNDRDLIDSLSKMILRSGNMVDAYGLAEATRTDDTLVMRSTRCGWRDVHKKAGLDKHIADEKICAAHQWYYWGVTQKLHPRMVMQFTKRITDGDDCCEWVYKILNTEKPTAEQPR